MCKIMKKEKIKTLILLYFSISYAGLKHIIYEYLG